MQNQFNYPKQYYYPSLYIQHLSNHQAQQVQHIQQVQQVQQIQQAQQFHYVQHLPNHPIQQHQYVKQVSDTPNVNLGNYVQNIKEIQEKYPNKLYLGGYLTTASQLIFIEHVYHKYYQNPFNCMNRNLEQLEIIKEKLILIESSDNLTSAQNYQNYRIVAEQLYYISKYLHNLYYYLTDFQLEKIFGNYNDESNPEPVIIDDFVNKMAHILQFKQYDRNKVIMLIDSVIAQIKNENRMTKMTAQYRKEQDKIIAQRLFGPR